MELLACRLHCRCESSQFFMCKSFIFLKVNMHSLAELSTLCIIHSSNVVKYLKKLSLELFPSFWHQIQIFLKYFARHSSSPRFHRQSSSSSLLLAFLIAYFSLKLNEGKFLELSFQSPFFAISLIFHSFATFVIFLNLFLAHHSLE